MYFTVDGYKKGTKNVIEQMLRRPKMSKDGKWIIGTYGRRTYRLFFNVTTCTTENSEKSTTDVVLTDYFLM